MIGRSPHLDTPGFLYGFSKKMFRVSIRLGEQNRFFLRPLLGLALALAGLAGLIFD